MSMSLFSTLYILIARKQKNFFLNILKKDIKGVNNDRK